MKTLERRLNSMRAAAVEMVPAEKRAIMLRATEDLAASGIVERARQVGDAYPAFALSDTTNAVVSSDDLLGRGPMIVSFFRGFW